MRYTVYHTDKALAFGSEVTCGEFLQIWKRPISQGERDAQDTYGPYDDDMLVDEDTNMTGLDRPKMETLIIEHGFVLGELEDAYRKANPSF